MINLDDPTQVSTNREVNSSLEIKKLLANFDNPEMNLHNVVLQQ